jgi:hypothetical protein
VYAIGQDILVSIPAPLNETEVERQNEIKKKRHKLLYKSKHPPIHFITFQTLLDKNTPNINNMIELEKRVSLSDEPSSSRNDSNDIDEGQNSVGYNIKGKSKDNQAFKFKQNGQLSHNQDLANRNSLSGVSSSSFIETGNRNSMHIFAPVNNLAGIEQSEIAKNANENSEMTSIQNAFKQVSSVLDAGNFMFNKNKRQQDHKNNFDAINKSTTADNMLFNKVNKNSTMKNPKHVKHYKLKKIRSDTGDLDHPYALNAFTEGKRAPSEHKNIEPFDVNESSGSIRNIGMYLISPLKCIRTPLTLLFHLEFNR